MSKRYRLQVSPFVVPTGDGKVIEEHHGGPSTGEDRLSIARMIAPPGWSEPAQVPDFDEYTLMVTGREVVVVDGDTIELGAGGPRQSSPVPAISSIVGRSSFEPNEVFFDRPPPKSVSE